MSDNSRQPPPPKKRKLCKRQRLKVPLSFESKSEDNIHGANVMDTPHAPNNSSNTNDNCRRDDIYGSNIIDTAKQTASWSLYGSTGKEDGCDVFESADAVSGRNHRDSFVLVAANIA
eukprot:73893_1